MKWPKSHLFAEDTSLARYRNSRRGLAIETLSSMGPLSADNVDPLDEKQNRREKQPRRAPHPAGLTNPPHAKGRFLEPPPFHGGCLAWLPMFHPYLTFHKPTAHHPYLASSLSWFAVDIVDHKRPALFDPALLLFDGKFFPTCVHMWRERLIIIATLEYFFQWECQCHVMYSIKLNLTGAHTECEIYKLYKKYSHFNYFKLFY